MSTAVMEYRSSSSIVDSHREGAEIYSGDPALCREKSIELLGELHLPLGLLPLEMDEVGYNRSTGFVWIKQKQKKEHTFKKINRHVSYATEVTGFVEDRRMRKMTGVKSKELLLWMTLVEMSVDPNDPDRITFRSSAGLYRTFPISAFNLEVEAAA